MFLSSSVVYFLKIRNGRSFDFQNQLAGEGESALVSWYPQQYRQPGTGTLHWSTAMTISIGVSLRVPRLDNRFPSLLTMNRVKKPINLKKKKHGDRGTILKKALFANNDDNAVLIFCYTEQSPREYLHHWRWHMTCDIPYQGHLEQSTHQ